MIKPKPSATQQAAESQMFGQTQRQNRQAGRRAALSVWYRNSFVFS
jgi:hypothetical protein